MAPLWVSTTQCNSPHHTAVLRRTAYTTRSAADFVERTAAQHWYKPILAGCESQQIIFPFYSWVMRPLWTGHCQTECFSNVHNWQQDTASAPNEMMVPRGHQRLDDGPSKTWWSSQGSCSVQWSRGAFVKAWYGRCSLHARLRPSMDTKKTNPGACHRCIVSTWQDLVSDFIILCHSIKQCGRLLVVTHEQHDWHV